MTDDEKYLVPDGSESKLLSACSYKATTEIYMGTQAYQNSLK